MKQPLTYCSRQVAPFTCSYNFFRSLLLISLNCLLPAFLRSVHLGTLYLSFFSGWEAERGCCPCFELGFHLQVSLLSPSWFSKHSLASETHPPLVHGSGPHNWLGLLQSCLWVGEPQTAAMWNADFQHMLLAACHRSSPPANITLQLKDQNCQPNVLATAPWRGCMGNLAATPASSKSREGVREGALGAGWCRGSWLPASQALFLVLGTRKLT